MAYLTVRIRDIAGHSTELLEGGDRLTLGRTSAADITIRSDSISREHCVFICEDGIWYLEDSGSANGTRVNSEKIDQRVTLQERDIIKIGKARLTFHVGKPGKRRQSEGGSNDAGIALDDGVSGTPVLRVLAGEPDQAMKCAECGTWFSIAHRLSGERIPCPRCDRQNTVPELIATEVSN